MLDGPTTRFAGIARGRAAALVAIILLALAGAIATGASTRQAFDALPSGGRDIVLYEHIVARMRAGDGYYPAAAVELEAEGYPRWSTFHTRLPTCAWLFATVPAWLGQLVLVAVALFATLVLAVDARRSLGWPMAVVQLVLYAGLFATCTLLHLAPELWSGALIALSLALYTLDRVPLAVAAGAAALAFRELALPYCVACLVVALVDRRRREALAWVVVLVAFSVALLLHAQHVAARPFALAGDGDAGWIRFGGLGFLVATCHADALLVAAPAWCSATCLVAGVAGVAGWRGPLGRRCGVAVGGYAVSFSVLGMPNRFYWGFVWLPLLLLGVARAPSVLRDLVASLRGAPTTR